MIGEVVSGELERATFYGNNLHEHPYLWPDADPHMHPPPPHTHTKCTRLRRRHTKQEIAWPSMEERQAQAAFLAATFHPRLANVAYIADGTKGAAMRNPTEVGCQRLFRVFYTGMAEG